MMAVQGGMGDANMEEEAHGWSAEAGTTEGVSAQECASEGHVRSEGEAADETGAPTDSGSDPASGAAGVRGTTAGSEGQRAPRVLQAQRSRTLLGARSAGSGEGVDEAWATFRAQYRLENYLWYKVAEVGAGRDALLDDVGRLIRAAVRAEVEPLIEAQAKKQHQVAELYTQHDELRIRMQDLEKELEQQRNWGINARNETLELVGTGASVRLGMTLFYSLPRQGGRGDAGQFVKLVQGGVGGMLPDV